MTRDSHGNFVFGFENAIDTVGDSAWRTMATLVVTASVVCMVERIAMARVATKTPFRICLRIRQPSSVNTIHLMHEQNVQKYTPVHRAAMNSAIRRSVLADIIVWIKRVTLTDWMKWAPRGQLYADRVWKCRSFFN